MEIFIMDKEYMDNLKIEDIPWDRMATAYGTAKNYPKYLAVLDSINNINKMQKAFDRISDFEHQSTMFPPAPFALVFLVRIYKKAKQTNTPESEWIIDKFNEDFEYYLEICDDADSMEHAEPLPHFSDMLDKKYLLPENFTEDDLDEFFENPDSMPDDYFYSLYYYSDAVLSEIQDNDI